MPLWYSTENYTEKRRYGIPIQLSVVAISQSEHIRPRHVDGRRYSDVGGGQLESCYIFQLVHYPAGGTRLRSLAQCLEMRITRQKSRTKTEDHCILNWGMESCMNLSSASLQLSVPVNGHFGYWNGSCQFAVSARSENHKTVFLSDFRQRTEYIDEHKLKRSTW